MLATENRNTDLVAEVLQQHVVFDIEGIDRMYLNVYVPQFQCEHGVVSSFGSSQTTLGVVGINEPDHAPLLAALYAYIEEHSVDAVHFLIGQRKDDVMAEHLAHFTAEEGIVFIA